MESGSPRNGPDTSVNAVRLSVLFAGRHSIPVSGHPPHPEDAIPPWVEKTPLFLACKSQILAYTAQLFVFHTSSLADFSIVRERKGEVFLL